MFVSDTEHHPPPQARNNSLSFAFNQRNRREFRRNTMKPIQRTHTYKKNLPPPLLPEELIPRKSTLLTFTTSPSQARPLHPHPLVRPNRNNSACGSVEEATRDAGHTSFLRGPRRSGIKKWHKSCCGGGCGPGGRGVLR